LFAGIWHTEAGTIGFKWHKTANALDKRVKCSIEDRLWMGDFDEFLAEEAAKRPDLVRATAQDDLEDARRVGDRG
jgi:hypothetical protein